MRSHLQEVLVSLDALQRTLEANDAVLRSEQVLWTKVKLTATVASLRDVLDPLKKEMAAFDEAQRDRPYYASSEMSQHSSSSLMHSDRSRNSLPSNRALGGFASVLAVLNETLGNLLPAVDQLVDAEQQRRSVLYYVTLPVMWPVELLRKPPLRKVQLYHSHLHVLTAVLQFSVRITAEKGEWTVEDLEKSGLTVPAFWYSYHPPLQRFIRMMQLATAALGTSYDYSLYPVRAAITVAAGAYYGAFPAAAAKKAHEVMEKGDIDFLKLIWNLLDDPILGYVTRIGLPALPIMENFYLPAPRLPAHLEHLSHPVPALLLASERVAHVIKAYRTTAHTPRGMDTLPSVSAEDVESFSPFDGSSIAARNLAHQPQMPVILHFHGGGFIAMSPTSHEYYLRQWAIDCNVPLISIEYSLAPDHPYPMALEECYLAYKYVAAGLLGITPTSLILVGDSSGGNLAAAVTLRAISDGIRVPDGVLLMYPALNMNPNATPSRLLSMQDPIVPHTFLRLCLNSYIGAGLAPHNIAGVGSNNNNSNNNNNRNNSGPGPVVADTPMAGGQASRKTINTDIPEDAPIDDPFFCPISASDTLLSQFPRTYLMVGSLDPLLDDSADFTHRLRENGRDVRLKVWEGLPHGFLNIAPVSLLNVVMDVPLATRAVTEVGFWLQELVRLPPSMSVHAAGPPSPQTVRLGAVPRSQSISSMSSARTIKPGQSGFESPRAQALRQHQQQHIGAGSR